MLDQDPVALYSLPGQVCVEVHHVVRIDQANEQRQRLVVVAKGRPLRRSQGQQEKKGNERKNSNS
jgi:hypothetical protein